MLHILVVGPDNQALHAQKIVSKFFCILTYTTPGNLSLPEDVDIVFNQRDKTDFDTHLKVKTKYKHRSDVAYFETTAGLNDLQANLKSYFRSNVIPPKDSPRVRLLIWAVFNFFGNKKYVGRADLRSCVELLEKEFEFSSLEKGVANTCSQLTLPERNWWVKSNEVGKYLWGDKTQLTKYLKNSGLFISKRIETHVAAATFEIKQQKPQPKTLPEPVIVAKEPVKKTEPKVSSDPIFDALSLMAKALENINKKVESISSVSSGLAKMSPEKRDIIEKMIATFGEDK